MRAVVLHDHLDGGVRPPTVAELAEARNLNLPVPAPELAGWFTLHPSMSFEEAWARFGLVISVLQDADALRRVAREAVEDLAADEVVYAELRFAPLSHREDGLSGEEVVAAVAEGLADGEGEHDIVTRLILCGIREQPVEVAVDTARLAVGDTTGRVVGFDMAGAEVDHPAEDYREAFVVAAEGGLGTTVHAGEMDGVASVASALACEPDRIGHGWRLIDDCRVAAGRIVELGPVAAEVRDRGLPLEVCLTSNASLGLPVEQHPVRLLHEAGFDVQPNPDDRAITTTTVQRELDLWRRHHGFTDEELADAHRRALAAAFCDDEARDRVAARLAG